MKPDDNLLLKLKEEFGLTQKQALFVVELRDNGGNQTQAHIMAGYKGDNYNSVKVTASQSLAKTNVKAAHNSLLAEKYPQKAHEFRLSKQKVLEDLEALKILATDNIEAGNGAGGAYNAIARASELQGKELGMFVQKHHHEHEHAIVPDRLLLDRLAQSNPALARNLGDHMGVVIEGEFEEE